MDARSHTYKTVRIAKPARCHIYKIDAVQLSNRIDIKFANSTGETAAAASAMRASAAILLLHCVHVGSDVQAI